MITPFPVIHERRPKVTGVVGEKVGGLNLIAIAVSDDFE